MTERDGIRTRVSSSAASDVLKGKNQKDNWAEALDEELNLAGKAVTEGDCGDGMMPVAYTHLRAHETVLGLVCRRMLDIK